MTHTTREYRTTADVDDVDCAAGLDEMLARYREPTPAFSAPHEAGLINGVVVGVLAGFTDSDEPLVALPADIAAQPRQARTTVSLRGHGIGVSVTVLFERGDSRRPIVVGVVQSATKSEETARPKAVERSVEVDGERIVLTGKREIVLQCGKSSITLTRAGKILVRGAYVLTDASGVNRIRGGSVQIN